MVMSDQEQLLIESKFSEIGFENDDARVEFLKRNTISYPYLAQEQNTTPTLYQLNTEVICPIGTK